MSVINYKDRGPITEEDLMPIRKDEAAMFASQEDILFFHHFYERGREEAKEDIRNKIRAELETTGYPLNICGLEKALSLI